MTHRPDDCQPIEDLLGAYAIDALEPSEANRVRSHVAACPRCLQEVDQHRATIGLVASAAGGEAPAGVWDAIAAAIEQAPGPRREPSAPALIERPPARRALWRRSSTWWGAAAAAVAALAAVAIGAQTIRVDHLDHRVNQLSAAARQSGGLQGAAGALVDPAAKHLTLTSTRPGARRLGELLLLPSGAAYLVSSALAPLPASSTYQLWSVVGGRAVSVGVLGAHPATVAFTVDPAVTVTAFLVTVEPAGGVVAPTSAPVARAAA